MATIVFSNGQRVNFEGNPTPQDVEEVAVKLGLQSPKVSEVPAPKPSYLQRLGQTFSSYLPSVGADIKKASEAITDMPDTKGDVVASAKAAAKGVGKLLYQGAIKPASKTVSTVFAPIAEIFHPVQQKLEESFAEDGGPTGVAGAFFDLLAKKIEDNPKGSEVAGDITNILLGVLGSKGGGGKIGTVKGVVEGVKSTPAKVSETVSGVKNTVKDYISEKIGGKKSEQILATPEAQVPKLSVKEQKVWYDNKAKTASLEAQNASLLAKQTSEQITKNLQDEITNFNQQIGQTSREKAIALKEPSKQLMRDSGDKYLELTGEAAEKSPSLTKKITSEELTNAIESKFEYNPEVGASLKSELGITEKAPSIQIDPKTKLPVIESGTPPVKTLTNQEVLNKARDIMQDVSRTARQGNRVYTSAEYQAMQKYSFLMEVLEKNGVAMTEANTFWKNWTPVRDRIVREVKPFDETNTQKMPFSSTLQKAEVTAKTSLQASAKVDAQNFISEIETRLDLPKGSIGAEIRQAVQGVEKAKLTQESLSQASKELQVKIRTDKAKALQKMSAKQYDTQRTAIIRARVKYTLISLGILAIGKLTGADRALLNMVGVIIP